LRSPTTITFVKEGDPAKLATETVGGKIEVITQVAFKDADTPPGGRN
jgi:hypothetical protein